MKQTLSARNKAFWAKSKSEQRIAVAKDVIASIKSGFYIAETGHYFHARLRKDLKPTEKLDKVFSEIKNEGGSCSVCGIGGCFTSLVRLGDTAKTEDFLDTDEDIENGTGIDDTEMRVLLRRVFPSEQLTLIECAFEMWDVYEDEKFVKDSEKEKAEDFGRLYDSPTERLISIMQNIIRNKGTFKP